MRVLVVDDDRAVRDALRRALTLGGYEVRSAEGGVEGLQQVGEARPDVQRAARLHRLSAPEARRSRRTRLDPERPRRRLRVARGRAVTLRSRMGAVAGLAVGGVGIAVAIA